MAFTGKSIVITGGTSGIGYELLKNLLERGAKNIAILDIADTDGVTTQLQANYPNEQTVLYLQTDVTDRVNVWDSFSEARSRFGRIDVVIGNAGICNEMLPELTIQVNLIGVLNSTQAAIEFMGKPNGGAGGIVMNIASLSGLDIFSGFEAYTASKFGIVGLTRSYAADVNKQFGIVFVVACPGHVHTPLTKSTTFLPDTNLSDIIASRRVMGVQRADSVGKALATVLENPTQATVYVLNDGKIIPFSIPRYWNLSG